MSKSLIAYFSRKGQNYANGNMVILKEGNTEVVAKIIQELTKADIYCVTPLSPYPNDYADTVEIAKEEYKSNARPELKNALNSIDEYDVIYLGYPNWCGTMPMPVWTFLESVDTKGKKILPFCTNEGSGLASSLDDIRKLCPEAEILDGLSIKGTRASLSKPDIAEWLRKNKQI